MSNEWDFSPVVIAEAQEIGIGNRVAIHWSEAECQDQEGTVVGVEICRNGKVDYAVHIDGDISPTDGFTRDISGCEGGTIRLLPYPVAGSFKPALGSSAADKLAEAKNILELIAFDGKTDRETITANSVEYLASGGRHPNHSTLAAAFLASLALAPQAQPTQALLGKAKPGDVTHEAWYLVSEILFAVTNNHHAWGALEHLPRGWTDELHEQLARALMSATTASNDVTLRPSAPRLADGWQQLLSAHVHKLELACMVDGGSVTWNQEGCRAMASLLRSIGEKLDIALERELAGDLEPPLISEAYVDAVVKSIVDLLENRARYFDGSKGHFDRADTARSYRTTAKEAATALRRALVSNAGQLQLELSSGDAAIDWITSNCPAPRKDNGELLYRLPQMVKAFQAGVDTRYALSGEEP